mmetsp:Transcript_9257/g.12281  ORF Transcript_9257/g.12281 Transcript_9257/m.12281 type:complete len:212 (+) Transcript_9257:45-680(+)
MVLSSRIVLTFLLSVPLTNCYVLNVGSFQTRRMDLSMKRGTRSFKKEIDGENSAAGGGGLGSKGKGGLGSMSINWCPIPAGQKLPEEQGTIGLLDTNLPTMKKSATNPTGAVAVVTFQDETYCFASGCPSCQIPLVKAKVLPPVEGSKSPRICCSFCKSTYSLKDGSKTAAAESGGMFGGIIKSVLSAQASGGLPMYKLGERNGKIVIAVD